MSELESVAEGAGAKVENDAVRDKTRRKEVMRNKEKRQWEEVDWDRILGDLEGGFSPVNFDRLA